MTYLKALERFLSKIPEIVDMTFHFQAIGDPDADPELHLPFTLKAWEYGKPKRLIEIDRLVLSAVEEVWSDMARELFPWITDYDDPQLHLVIHRLEGKLTVHGLTLTKGGHHKFGLPTQILLRPAPKYDFGFTKPLSATD